jgi:hypothetical protein
VDAIARELVVPGFFEKMAAFHLLPDKVRQETVRSFFSLFFFLLTLSWLA